MNFMQLLVVLKARKTLILLTLALSVALVGAVSWWLPKAYTATASLLVNIQGADPVSGLSMASQLIPGYRATQVDILTSRNVGLKVVDNLKLVEDAAFQQQFQRDVQGRIPMRDWLADALLGNLDVQPSRESSVLYVSYTSADPQIAARLANAFVQAYIQTNLELKTQPARQTAAWYDEQLGELRNNLEKSQTKLSSYQQSKGIVSLDDKLDTETARLTELSSQLVAAQGQTYENLSIRENISNASAGVVNNPLIQGIKAELARSEAKLNQLAQREGKNYPEYQRTQAEVDTLLHKLASESKVAGQSIKSNLEVARQRERELRAAVAAQKAKVLALNAERDVGAVLAREVESGQRVYDQALQRLGQNRLEGHAGQTEVAVLSSALVPLIPATPKLSLNIVLAVVLGTLLGIGWALILEMLDRRVRSEYDLVELLGVPVLGVLGAEGAEKQRLPWRGWIGLPAPKSL